MNSQLSPDQEKVEKKSVLLASNPVQEKEQQQGGMYKAERGSENR